jgi:hypothetical protein
MLGASSEFEQYTTNEVMMFFIHALSLNLFLLSSLFSLLPIIPSIIMFIWAMEYNSLFFSWFYLTLILFV